MTANVVNAIPVWAQTLGELYARSMRELAAANRR